MEYNLKLTKDDVDLIGKALLELPAKEVLGTFAKIKVQCTAQNGAAMQAAALTALHAQEQDLPVEAVEDISHLAS